MLSEYSSVYIGKIKPTTPQKAILFYHIFFIHPSNEPSETKKGYTLPLPTGRYILYLFHQTEPYSYPHGSDGPITCRGIRFTGHTGITPVPLRQSLLPAPCPASSTRNAFSE